MFVMDYTTADDYTDIRGGPLKRRSGGQNGNNESKTKYLRYLYYRRYGSYYLVTNKNRLRSMWP